MTATLSCMERVVTALSHREPDRVPLFLPLTLHGAQELGLSLRAYYSRPEYVAEGQWRLRAKYGNDILFGFYHAPLEVEAWGGEVLYREDGPPNSGEPPLARLMDWSTLTPPRVAEAPGLQRALETIRQLRARAGAEIPIAGVVVGSFSLPVMQLGFERYLDLLHDAPERLEQLLAVNEAFAVEWANAQLAAGATFIVYFDPVLSPTLVPPEVARRAGLPGVRRTLARINSPSLMGLASGRCLPILDDLLAVGAAGVAVSAQEDLAVIKARCQGRLLVVGNLNALEMVHWTPAEAERHVKAALAQAARGGGFVLSDNHGEIPWQVSEDTLHATAEAARRWGQYPLRWIED